MADHLTEEEQIEALKNWWKAYWKSVVIPVVAVVGGYFGWTMWDEQREIQAAEGHKRYQALVEVMETTPGATLSDEKRSEATVLASAIAEEFSGSLYADNANFILARLAVDKKELEEAAGFLQRVVGDGANEAVKLLAKARLARVKLALGDQEGALALVAVSGESEYASLFAEIRGDVLAAQGKADAARTAFEEAMESLPAQEFQRRSILQIKLDGVDILAGNVASPEETPEATEDAEASDSEESETPVAAAENS